MGFLDEWEEAEGKTDEALSLDQMDALIKQMRDKREEYEEQKKLATDKYKEYQELEHKVILALENSGKKSYKVDGLGTFSLVYKQVITTPKTVEDKRKFFDYVKEKYGDDYLDSLRSVNHQTLNSFYNEEAKNAEDPSMFGIPGLDQPTIKTEARFRKENKS